MKEKLIADILSESPSYTASRWIIERIPFIFNDNLEDYIDWKERLSTLIEVDSKAITFVGSSCVGFSLNPSNNFSSFHDGSDVDVAIISGHYFDTAWHFLRNIGASFHRYTQIEQNSIFDHKRRLIFHGTIATDKIIQILPFGKKWMDAIAEMKTIAPTLNRDINFRIYKDFEALKAYQVIGVAKSRDYLLSK
jgi:hypothetical protein